jgi:methylated-DNA-[protein]-cysteine S-methyltransferase
MRARDLRRLAPTRLSAARSRTLSDRLGDVASARGELDIALGTVGTPIGDLLVAVTPRGLARVAFADERREEVLLDLLRRISPRILESARATEEVRRQLEQYFDHRRTGFDLPVDRSLIRGIAAPVLSATSRIPYGRTSTYGELARRIGHPKAARAVGNALGSNPIPIVIPCHRILRTGGALGGYGGGVDRKEYLLDLEGATRS